MQTLSNIATMLGFKKRRTILVTDATSDIGFEAVRALSQHKKTTVIAGITDTKHERVEELRDLNVKVLPFTVSEPETLTTLKTVHKIIIIPSCSENRVETTLKIVDAAKKYKVKRLTLISVLGATTWATGYTKQYHTIEQYIKEKKFNYTFLRCAPFMETYLIWKPQIQKGLLPLPTKDMRWAPVSCTDVGEAAAAVTFSGHKNKEYDLTGPHCLSAMDQAEVFTGVLGHRVKYLSITTEEAKRALQKLGAEDWQAKELSECYDNILKAKCNRVSPHLKQILNRKPTPLEDYIELNRRVFLSK